MIEIQGKRYEIIEDYRSGWSEEDFVARYSEVLNKYDYIVGDWGYEMLRLKGFHDDKNRKSPLESRINSLNDYLYEYCNFGCAYFVLKRVKEDKNQKIKEKNKDVQEEALS